MKLQVLAVGLLESLIVALFCIWITTKTAHSAGKDECKVDIFIALSLALTEGPVSVSTLIGENALFHCNGSGYNVGWRVDGLLGTDISIQDRGIADYTVSSSTSGTVQSTLTVPATLVNNGTTVYCIVYPSSEASNNATLTVLPGEP